MLTAERAKICCCTVSSSLQPTHGGTAAPENTKNTDEDTELQYNYLFTLSM